MKRKVMAVALLASGAVFAQMAPQRNQPVQPGPAAIRPVPAPLTVGGPLADLTATEAAAFEAGRNAFVEVERPETGLGPTFNGRSCVQCHGTPVAGGSSPITVTRFGRMVNGVFDAMESQGGSLLQRLSTVPGAQEVVPASATVVVQRESTPLFGLGLIEAIPDEAIVAQASVPKPDGVRGRAAVVRDPATGEMRVGRFGWKAQHATLLGFAADAYRNEMGVTNRFFPTENAPNGDASRITNAPGNHAGIEDDTDVDAVAVFMRFLAPPPAARQSASAQAGQAVFHQVGCAACHVPAMVTGRVSSAALSERVVALFSDLLLHDMGSLNDGIAQEGAAINEMKTPPLWSLRFSAPYLHDGRAPTLDQALRAHDGEARPSRDRYLALPPAQRQQLLDFLSTL